MRRVILTTGGTGGHIFPALAVAEEISRRYPKARILFLGGQYGPEADLAARAGLEYVGLPVRGVMGRGLRALAAAGA
ncbi:glycosyltransferase, partial [Nitratidesulfovibrio liaohensis]|uniref:glycosyltransferase n=1 Tax=Nitratidesulfovibrio liaohensis TaxID=2604158 RepID=UPI001AAE3EB5